MPSDRTAPGERILEQVRRAREERPTPGTESVHLQYLTVRLRDQLYALRVEYLVEILPAPRITRVPSVPEHILGVMNFRGEVLSVIDLKRFFSLPQSEPAEDRIVVVVKHGEVRTGLLVDGVGDLVPLSPKDLTEESLVAGRAQRATFEGVARFKGGLVSLINLEGLLQSDNMFATGR
ncbi:MAG TPA: chemotaxis protein CheW [Syntrophobacteria bacterium]|nr:chemotaxis protein CheW [Syntrophobacteria bacterium]